jgi:hypothetical protein
MSDYAAIVDRRTFAPRILAAGLKPYWSTNSADGRHCYVSASGDDKLSVISYDGEEIVRQVPVGDHPQRVRNGVARVDVYPVRGTGERFRFRVSHERPPIAIRDGEARVGCRAKGARALRLAQCAVRLERRHGSRWVVLARGERAVGGRRAFAVDVALTDAGRRVVRRRPLGFDARIVAEGVDSAGRLRTVRKTAEFRRAG